MCERIKFGDGDIGLICGGRHSRPLFCACGRSATALCDWKMGADKTCDRPICEAHAKQVARGKHLCPEHQLLYDEWLRRHPPAQRNLFDEAAA
jgi:hypothetical protein